MTLLHASPTTLLALASAWIAVSALAETPAPPPQDGAIDTAASTQPAVTPKAAPHTPSAAPRRVMRKATLFSEVDGRVSQLPHKRGDVVEAGEVLVAFDCDALQLRRDRLLAVQVSAKDRHLTQLRLQSLDAADQVAVSLAAAAVDKAIANTRQLDQQVQGCRITAPFASTVTRIHIRDQDQVAAYRALVDLVAVSSTNAQAARPAALPLRLEPDVVMVTHAHNVQDGIRVSPRRANLPADASRPALEVELAK